MEHHTPKGFFEKYQTFFSIIIAAVVIAGGIVISKGMPAKTGEQAAQGQTEAQVRAELIKTANNLSLDSKALGVCLDTKAKESAVNDAITLAAKSGVQGTPTFIIIKRTYGADDRITSEKQIPIIGARDTQAFVDAIEKGTPPEGQPELKGDKVVLSDTDHYIGPKRAETIIVEYSDIDCAFCKRAKPTVDSLLKAHPEYAFVYRHSPLVQLHPFAAYKAQAAECIAASNGEEGFWKFINVIAR